MELHEVIEAFKKWVVLQTDHELSEFKDNDELANEAIKNEVIKSYKKNLQRIKHENMESLWSHVFHIKRNFDEDTDFVS